MLPHLEWWNCGQWKYETGKDEPIREYLDYEVGYQNQPNRFYIQTSRYFPEVSLRPYLELSND